MQFCEMFYYFCGFSMEWKSLIDGKKIFPWKKINRWSRSRQITDLAKSLISFSNFFFFFWCKLSPTSHRFIVFEIISNSFIYIYISNKPFNITYWSTFEPFNENEDEIPSTKGVSMGQHPRSETKITLNANSPFLIVKTGPRRANISLIELINPQSHIIERHSPGRGGGGGEYDFALKIQTFIAPWCNNDCKTCNT